MEVIKDYEMQVMVFLKISRKEHHEFGRWRNGSVKDLFPWHWALRGL